jgi:predicted ATPase/DNA-binding CsgD family transcriptional regulator
MASLKELPQTEGLSKRAAEILRLLAEGMSDREIAERLVMTINTVKWYNRQIYSILGVGSRTQAIARARELQLLDEEHPTKPSLTPVRPAVKHNLPVETTRFIGRKHELGVIKQLLETAHLLTLVGPPGTGKTRLALQVAWETADRFPDGSYFVSLAAINSPALVINTIACVIGVNETHDQPLIETLKHVLRESRLLLILDNFEHLLPAAKQVSELLAAAPRLKVLATSREPLHLYGEQEYAVPPLELPDPERLDPQALAACESTALFMQQARSVRSDFALTADNALDVAKICVRLEGLPLAIELAAARIKLLTPRVLLARLVSRLDTLRGGAHDLPARQQTLHNTIEWSYNLLNDGEKLLFARLAVFRGGCSLEAIETVCGQGLPIHVFDGLESLVNKSLIQQRELAGGEPRFVMLETLHEYAWERLGETGTKEEITGRHAVYYLDFIARSEAACYGAEPQTAIDAIWRDLDNIRQAWQWGWERATAEPDLLVALDAAVDGLAAFYEVTSLFEEGQGMFTGAVEAIANGRHVEPVRCHLLARLAEFAEWRGELEQSAATAAQVIELAEQLHLPRYQADGLRALGILKRDTGAPEQAIHHLKEAMEMYRSLGAKRPLAVACDWLGLISSDLGRLDEAMAYLGEAAVLYAEAGNERGMVFNKGMTAVVLSVMGRLEESAVYQRDVLARYQKLKYLLGEERTANNLGLLLLELGEFEEALVQMERALELSQQIGSLTGYYTALGNKGEILLSLDAYEGARDCLEQAGRFYHEAGMGWLESENLWRQAWLLTDTGKYEQAQAALDGCLALAPPGDAEAVAMAHSLLAEIARQLSDQEQAMAYLDQAAAAFQAARRPVTVARFVLIPRADLLLERGEIGAAAEALAQVEPYLVQAGRNPVVFASRLLEAKITAARGNQAEAQRQLAELLSTKLRLVEEAAVYYELWNVSGDGEYGREAFGRYERLAAGSPNLAYRHFLAALRAGPTPPDGS